ncbi:MAG: hypothetical protein L0H64_15705 [Pseudonocardia sp.]|nr:hypothetical protein [Pseudonocardia sp.]
MYSYDILPEVRDYVDGMPVAALASYAELIGFMELTPWDAPAYRQDKPDANMRKMLFGPGSEDIAVYLILDEQRRVIVVSVTWVD